MTSDLRRLEELTEQLPPTPSLTSFISEKEINDYIDYDINTVGTFKAWGLFRNEKVAVGRAFMSKGSIFPQHQHTEAEILICESGFFSVTQNGIFKEYKPGECCRIPPNVIHSCNGIEDTWIVMITVPPSEGYPDA